MLSTWCSCLGKSEAVVLINVVFNLKKLAYITLQLRVLKNYLAKLLLGREK